MPRVTGGEAGDFDVVSHDVARRGQRTDLPFEELLLVVPARPPRQHAADVEVFAEDVAHHVFGADAFGRRLIMGAAGGVDVVVAGVPAALG